MKKTILLITAATVLFNFSTAFAQDKDIDRALANLASVININASKIDNIKNDLLVLAKSNKSRATFSIRDIYVVSAGMVHVYLYPLLTLRQSVREDSLKYYNKIVYQYLVFSKETLEQCNGGIQGYYSYLENRATMHTVDKVKEVIRDSISEIDSVLKLLPKK